MEKPRKGRDEVEEEIMVYVSPALRRGGRQRKEPDVYTPNPSSSQDGPQPMSVEPTPAEPTPALRRGGRQRKEPDVFTPNPSSSPTLEVVVLVFCPYLRGCHLDPQIPRARVVYEAPYLFHWVKHVMSFL